MNIPFEVGQKIKTKHGVSEIKCMIVYKDYVSFELSDGNWVYSIDDLKAYKEPLTINNPWNKALLDEAIDRGFVLDGVTYEVRVV